MRKDASTLAAWELTPTDIATIGFRGGSFEDIARACDRWLQKRNLKTLSPYVKFGSIKAFEPKKAKVKKPRKVRKYATADERIKELREKALAQWANMTPEEKAERIRKNNSLRNQNGKGQTEKA